MTMPNNKESATQYSKRLGLALRNLRIAHGMTQSDLGSYLGITFQQIQKYEQGTNRVSVPILAKMSEVLGEEVWNIARNITDSAVVRATRMNLETASHLQVLEISEQSAVLNLVKAMVGQRKAA